MPRAVLDVVARVTRPVERERAFVLWPPAHFAIDEAGGRGARANGIRTLVVRLRIAAVLESLVDGVWASRARGFDGCWRLPGLPDRWREQ